jgi:hypothetical protein
MEPMSNREKLIATLNCQKINFVPISPLGINSYEWTNDFPAYRKIIDAVKRHGTPIVKIPMEGSAFMCDPKETRPKTETKVEDGVENIRTTLLTPKGELTSLSQRNPKVGGSPAHIKFLVENEEDIEKMLSLKSFKTFLPDVSGLLAKQKEVGDNGLCCINGLSSPFLIAANQFKYEYFLEFAFLNKGVLREIIDTNYRRLETLISYLLDKKVGPAFRWYNIEGYTSPMMPPSFADEFIVPSDTKLIKRIKDAGGLIDNHCHGRLREQAHNFVKMGVHCINCVEPPPANDIDLKDLKALTQGKICFWGYVQWEDMERKTEKEIRVLTREALEMSGGYGFILSQAASAYAAEISENFSNNILAMIDEGMKFNRDLAKG